MDFPKILVQLAMVVGVVELATRAQAQALPGCPSQCGNLKIPYPFGTQENCYLNRNFLITCNDSFTPPQPILKGAVFADSDYIVTRIDLEGQLEVLNTVVSGCYNQETDLPLDLIAKPSSAELLQFTISNTQNKFVGVGCDALATVRGYPGNGGKYTTGCVSVCNNKSNIASDDMACYGDGCCQISLPERLGMMEVNLSSFGNDLGARISNPCSYAFVVKEKAFNFSTFRNGQLGNTTKVPMVIDWTVGYRTCAEAQENQTSYECKGNNTTCYDSDYGPGFRSSYRCRCKDGYQGNPYIGDCQDINECENSSHKCPEQALCVNTMGSYTCHCPKGYYVDGKPQGVCITDPSPTMNIIFVVIFGGVMSLLLLCGSFFYLYKFMKKRRITKLKEDFFKRNGGLLLQQQLSSDEGTVEKTKIFSSKELEKATYNFSVNRILGQGGQGTVYKGMLSDGKIVAVKKSKMVDETQLEQFINEVVILSQINHRNIVKLFGCCLETEVPLLVYEFIPNGNLFQLIHNETEEFIFSWQMRLQVAIEVAGALAYLHSASSRPIYHRDVKSANILLDEKYRVKVSDFGTSRSIPIDKTHLTTRVQGTFGYLDPEYFQSSQFTEKSDVYSFGVVLVELLSGQKAISSIKSEEEKSLVMRFIFSLKEKQLLNLVDARVIKEAREEEIIAFADIAKRCLSLHGIERPTMKEVMMELEGIRMSHTPLNIPSSFHKDECIIEMEGPFDYAWNSTQQVWPAAEDSFCVPTLNPMSKAFTFTSRANISNGEQATTEDSCEDPLLFTTF